MLISFFMGLSIGAGVVISRYFGANDRQGVSDSIHTSMAIIILAGIAMTFIGVLLTPYIQLCIRDSREPASAPGSSHRQE